MEPKAITYNLHEVAPYINWMYFYYTWGFLPKFGSISKVHHCPSCRQQWIDSFPEKDRAQAREAAKLFDEANKVINEMDGQYHTHGLFRLLAVNSEEDDLLIYPDEEPFGKDYAEGQKAGRTSIHGKEPFVFPCLRQQKATKPDAPFLCLSDFIRPLSMGKRDCVAVFCASVDAKLQELHDDSDPYTKMLYQVVCDRLAEATTERLHEEIRKTYWGYAADEQLSIEEMLKEKYQGIRPAAGYPSFPDISVNELIDELVEMKRIGVKLTDNFMMYPHASVSGMMFAHPQAHYFNVGKITEEQVKDYALRRKKPYEELRKFLIHNLEV